MIYILPVQIEAEEKKVIFTIFVGTIMILRKYF